MKYDLTGFYNFREGGGMAAGEGRVRTQHLLRSDFPQSFGAESVEYMQEVPVSAVIDLRTDPEIESQPSQPAALQAPSPDNWRDKSACFQQIPKLAPDRNSGSSGDTRAWQQ